MRKEITYLPDNKQQELIILVKIIRKHYPLIAMIILFGSYARDDWVEEKYEDNIHYRYQSDFDILILVQEHNKRCKNAQLEMEQDLEEIFSESDKIETPVSILVHDLDFVNAHLAKTQYFFSDIRREGILLYGSEQFQLQKAKKLTKKERQQIAQDDFEFWFESANNFYEVFKFCLIQQKLSNSAFELHQVTERLYTTVLLVYTRYKPSTHDLCTLRKMVNSIDDRFGQVFLLDNQENKRLFNLLRAAYVDARYKKTYTITCEELVKLQKKVNKLQTLTEKLCGEKIASFDK